MNGILRWHLAEKERPKVTNDVGILFKPGILIAKGNCYDTFTFGIRAEVGVPVSIDVHERVSVVTGGYIPFTYFINTDRSNSGGVPLLIRLGVEIKANDNVAPWFYFDLGPGSVSVRAAAARTPRSPGVSALAPPSGASWARTRTSRTPRRPPRLNSPALESSSTPRKKAVLRKRAAFFRG